ARTTLKNRRASSTARGRGVERERDALIFLSAIFLSAIFLSRFRRQENDRQENGGQKNGSSDLDPDTLQKIRGLFAAGQREDIIIPDSRGRSGRLWIAFARAHQFDSARNDLFDRLAEVGFDAALVNAFVDHHFVAELQIAFEIAADYERDGVVAPTDDRFSIFRPIGGQINGGFDCRISCPDNQDVAS